MNKARVIVDLENQEIDKGLREFKRKLKKERVLEDVKRKRYHEKPSDVRRRERLKARRRYLRKQRKALQIEMGLL